MKNVTNQRQKLVKIWVGQICKQKKRQKAKKNWQTNGKKNWHQKNMAKKLAA